VRSVQQELRVRGLCRELAIAPLPLSATVDFIGARLGSGTSSVAFARRMHEQTGGNPLFVIAAIDSMIARGVIVRADGRWNLDAAVSRLPALVPDSLREIIQMQIERLDDSDQALLSIACVAGLRFNAALIADELGIDAERAEQRCERLAERKMILRRDGSDELPDGTLATAYTFQHSLYYEVLLRRQPLLRRARMLQRIAERFDALRRASA
jgi:predicted ATPase